MPSSSVPGSPGFTCCTGCGNLDFRHGSSRPADGVGGTWYWNRYPGARCDSESYYYSYSFSDEIQQEWEWTCRYPDQPEILRYLNYVADKLDLRRDIQFKHPRHGGAITTSKRNRWDIETDAGRRVSARFFIIGGRLPVGGAGAGHQGPRKLRGQLVPHRPLAA